MQDYTIYDGATDRTLEVKEAQKGVDRLEDRMTLAEAHITILEDQVKKLNTSIDRLARLLDNSMEYVRGKIK